ncbi:SOS response-associated peptidase [Mesorhizobium sp. CO1-1-9]|uniref:SOS response-associated peptidase family protein n=1 Tax=Mesorhizobium sp. CO1-1-11 TaxID=2876636 RepID=UPI001CCA43A4|nr:SOS response-associated peptidase family protein [Mesorhizobium sp. CO1-1-11]MBZ9698681.1 SOS response-associated peptidase [Mesorhizobium sp. CO1-1-9]MBZ9727573.1 SOS response-associated peptidase [Mesorhizobium sp. CO1-1-11]
MRTRFRKDHNPRHLRRFEFAHPGEVERLGNSFPLWNGGPSLTYPIIIREELSTSMAGFVSARWGLVAGWARDGGGRPPPVNARCETIASNGLFRKACSCDPSSLRAQP